MRIVPNGLIPFNGFGAVNLCGIVFIRRAWLESHDAIALSFLLNHERIHSAQMRELAYLGFYIVYLLEWIFRLIFHTDTAYRGISFEREAAAHEYDHYYLDNRKSFAQWRKG